MDRETNLRDDVWLIEKEAGWYLEKRTTSIKLVTGLFQYDSAYTPQMALDGIYQIGNLPSFKIYDKEIHIPEL